MLNGIIDFETDYLSMPEESGVSELSGMSESSKVPEVSEVSEASEVSEVSEVDYYCLGTLDRHRRLSGMT